MSEREVMAFVDSHTEGEPTRVVHEGLPDLGSGSLAERRAALERLAPGLRAAIVDEPRGYSSLVAVLLYPASDPGLDGELLFANNVGTLPMCIHASIGVGRTLVELGLRPDEPWSRPARFATPDGEIAVMLEAEGSIAVAGVRSYRIRHGVDIETRSFGTIRGQLAWGGNGFFIVEDGPVPVAFEHLAELEALAAELREGLDASGVRGPGGAAIDHVQLCGPSEVADARNFVLCPGGAYDRSPCGTGTSARMACLAAEGRLAPGQRWVQEGITGSTFVGSYEPMEGGIRPTVRGRAWITARGQLIHDPRDEIAPWLEPSR